MALLVVSRPTLPQADFDWIQGMRAAHDPVLHAQIDPHFTLVSPLSGLAEAKLVEHVQRVAEQQRSFAFVLRSALAVEGKAGGPAQLYLVPGEGIAAIMGLHDMLYRGPLAAYVRAGAEFIPHVTVARTPGVADCEAMAEEINGKMISVRGRVEELEVVEQDGADLRLIQRVPLRGTRQGDGWTPS